MRTIDRQTERVASATRLYPHPHTGAIHVMTLHASGAVDEGHSTTADGALSVRAERADGDGRALLDDVPHRALAD